MIAGSRNFTHAVSVPLKIFGNLFLNPLPPSSYMFPLKLFCFLQLQFGFRHILCNFSISPLLFTSDYAVSDIAEEWFFLLFSDFWKYSPAVCLGSVRLAFFSFFQYNFVFYSFSKYQIIFFQIKRIFVFWGILFRIQLYWCYLTYL